MALDVPSWEEAVRKSFENQEKMKRMDLIKLVTIGDRGVGKTSMLISYTNGYFPQDFIPCYFGEFLNASSFAASRGTGAISPNAVTRISQSHRQLSDEPFF